MYFKYVVCYIGIVSQPALINTFQGLFIFLFHVVLNTQVFDFVFLFSQFRF